MSHTLVWGGILAKYRVGIPPLLRHPAETSKNSDICDFLKVSDIGKSIVLNGETYILNDKAQFCEHILEIYIEKFAAIGTSELR